MLFRWFIIFCCGLGFYGLVYQLSNDSHHTITTVANIGISWACFWAIIFGVIVALRVRTR